MPDNMLVLFVRSAWNFQNETTETGQSKAVMAPSAASQQSDFEVLSK